MTLKTIKSEQEYDELMACKSYVSAVLNRRKPLTLTMAKFFYRELGIPASVLLA